MKVAVLALQGGYQAHCQAVRELRHQAVEARSKADLEGADALVLPGGESTALLRLLDAQLREAIGALARSGRPVLATCAGLILAARSVIPRQESLGLLDAEVRRNAWGRQIASFAATADDTGLPLVFIRAPRIQRLGPGVEILARFQGEPVLVRQGSIVAATFHPELTSDRRVHALALGR